MLCWPGQPGGNLLYRSLTGCPTLLDASLAATWRIQRQRGDGANEMYQPSTGWQAQPEQRGCLAKVSLLLRDCQPFRS